MWVKPEFHRLKRLGSQALVLLSLRIDVPQPEVPQNTSSLFSFCISVSNLRRSCVLDLGQLKLCSLSCSCFTCGELELIHGASRVESRVSIDIWVKGVCFVDIKRSSTNLKHSIAEVEVDEWANTRLNLS
jgi:hypothetical protein